MAAARPRLLGLLTGTLAPDSGNVKLGANLQMAALDQNRDSLDPDWTLKEALTGGKGDTVTHRRADQACRRLHEGFPVLARADRHAVARACPAASAAA